MWYEKISMFAHSSVTRCTRVLRSSCLPLDCRVFQTTILMFRPLNMKRSTSEQSWCDVHPDTLDSGSDASGSDVTHVLEEPVIVSPSDVDVQQLVAPADTERLGDANDYSSQVTDLISSLDATRDMLHWHFSSARGRHSGLGWRKGGLACVALVAILWAQQSQVRHASPSCLFPSRFLSWEAT